MHILREKRGHASGGVPGVIYGMGLIGAAIYYLQRSDTLLEGVIGILKALVWPAFLIYKFLEFFKL